MKGRINTLILLLVLSILSSACATTLRSSFDDQCRAKGWTSDQCKETFYYGLRLKFTRENDKGNFDVYYAILPVDLAANIIKSRLDDINYALNYNNKDWAKYIKELDLRAELEREERVLKAVYSRLEIYRLNNRFKDLMGEGSSRPRHIDNAYDSSKVFVEDVLKAYPFNSVMIDEARAKGTLKEIGRTVWFDQRKLGKKDRDPNDPEDSNKFIWKPVKAGIEFVSYKILNGETPKENNAEYIEGTRIEVAGNNEVKRESKPALRLFVPTLGYGSILVVDKDLQGEIGSGLPDFVEQIERITTADRLLNQSVISMLFQEDQKNKRVPPKEPLPITVEIARVGQNKIDIWETNSDGWTVPLRYKNESLDNYSISVRIRGSEKEDFDSSKPKKIASVRKEWDSNGKVVEYYKPKPPYDETNIDRVSAYSKNITIDFLNGDRVEGRVTSGVNKFISDKPYAIAYDYSEGRWMIVDEDGDGKYEKKREMSGSSELTHH